MKYEFFQSKLGRKIIEIVINERKKFGTKMKEIPKGKNIHPLKVERVYPVCGCKIGRY